MGSFKIDFIFDFMPTLDTLSPELIQRLTHKMNNTLDRHDFIRGVFILSTRDKQPVIYSKSLADFDSISRIAELINSFNMKFLIKSLSAKGYHGMEAMDFPEFGIAFAKVSDDEILSILTTKEQVAPAKVMNTVVDEVRNMLDEFNAEEDKIRSLPVPNHRDDNTSSVPRPKKKED